MLCSFWELLEAWEQLAYPLRFSLPSYQLHLKIFLHSASVQLAGEQLFPFLRSHCFESVHLTLIEPHLSFIICQIISSIQLPSPSTEDNRKSEEHHSSGEEGSGGGHDQGSESCSSENGEVRGSYRGTVQGGGSGEVTEADGYSG